MTNCMILTRLIRLLRFRTLPIMKKLDQTCILSGGYMVILPCPRQSLPSCNVLAELGLPIVDIRCLIKIVDC